MKYIIILLTILTLNSCSILNYFTNNKILNTSNDNIITMTSYEFIIDIADNKIELNDLYKINVIGMSMEEKLEWYNTLKG